MKRFVGVKERKYLLIVKILMLGVIILGLVVSGRMLGKAGIFFEKDSFEDEEVMDPMVIVNEESDVIDGSWNFNERPASEKPVIYLYPIQEQEVQIKLKLDGELSVTYPEYNEGWRVKAFPDGRLINLADNREYSYLYWEGEGERKYDMNEGFVVRGEDSASFLQDKLEYLGLTPREYNEFIVYWLPKMKDNSYNFVRFATKKEYDDKAVLEITPEPDSVLRVFMVLKQLNVPINVEEQRLEPFDRVGFSVIEWGGTEIN